mgnify:FL=1
MTRINVFLSCDMAAVHENQAFLTVSKDKNKENKGALHKKDGIRDVIDEN